MIVNSEINIEVFTENGNRPHHNGIIDPSNFSPFPKNPVIAKFFKEIGRVDELGSGVRNAFKYTPSSQCLLKGTLRLNVQRSVLFERLCEDKKVKKPCWRRTPTRARGRPACGRQVSN
jgi:hypothetical protein